MSVPSLHPSRALASGGWAGRTRPAVVDTSSGSLRRLAATGRCAWAAARCACVLLLIAATAGLAGADAAALNRPNTILFFGDSLTAGYGLDEAEAYPALVEGLAHRDGLPWRCLNAGVSGDTSAGGRRRIAWALRARPDLVVVALGANDGLRGLPLPATADNLVAIIRAVQAAGSQAVLAGMLLPLNYGETYRTAFADLYPRVARATQVPLIPFLLAGVGGQPAFNQADGIHPNAAGSQRVAALVYAFLRRLPALAPAGPPTAAP